MNTLTTEQRNQIIEAAHAAQIDAGSLIWFKKQFEHESSDPIVNMIKETFTSEEDIDGVASRLKFYSSELLRVSEAIDKLT